MREKLLDTLLWASLIFVLATEVLSLTQQLRFLPVLILWLGLGVFVIRSLAVKPPSSAASTPQSWASIREAPTGSSNTL